MFMNMINTMKKTKHIFSLLFFTSIASAQINKYACQDLRSRFTPFDTPVISNNSWFHIDTKGIGQELNYITPLRRVFLNQIAWSFDDGSWEYIAGLLSFVGDYQGSMNIIRKHNIYESENTPASKPEIILDKNLLISCTDLLNAIDTCKVVMINEDHNRVQPRAFLLSILPQLKSQGFTHLAMETLNHVKQNDVSINTGYFTAEPIFGEVVREALRLGFTLVPYEDANAIKHTNAERELAQATNIYNAIKAAPKYAKFLVVAGHAHIAEDFPDGTLSTMAMQFKALSGIDPITIDQLTSQEESGYPNDIIFSQLSKGLKTPKAIFNTSDAISVGLAHYDAFIIHPLTKLIHCRPDWLICNGLKKDYGIECKNKKAVLIQAYYKNEISAPQFYNNRIPADQTFYLDANGFVHLFLIPGNNYVIVFRDENNKIIQTQKIKA
jgi:hypothetical protein